jgi:hypothetical protein
MARLKLDLHEIYNRPSAIDREFEGVIHEAVARRIRGACSCMFDSEGAWPHCPDQADAIGSGKLSTMTTHSESRP